MNSAVSTISLMGNLLYVFHETGFLVLPYAGAGIGWAQHEVDDVTSPRLPGYKLEGESANAFAYQFMLGIKCPIDTIELGVGYRLLGTTEADFEGTKVEPVPQLRAGRDVQILNK